MKIEQVVSYDGTLGGLAAFLQRLVAAIAAGWNVEHNLDGTHRRVSFPSTQTTVGAAGSGTALPATPTGYVTIAISGTEYVIPYYAKS